MCVGTSLLWLVIIITGCCCLGCWILNWFRRCWFLCRECTVVVGKIVVFSFSITIALWLLLIVVIIGACILDHRWLWGSAALSTVALDCVVTWLIVIVAGPGSSFIAHSNGTFFSCWRVIIAGWQLNWIVVIACVVILLFLISKVVPLIIIIVITIIVVWSTTVLAESCGWNCCRFWGWIIFSFLNEAVVWALDEFPNSNFFPVPIGWTSVGIIIEWTFLILVSVNFILIFILFALVWVEEIATTASSVSTENHIWLYHHEHFVRNERVSVVYFTEYMYTIFLKMNKML